MKKVKFDVCGGNRLRAVRILLVLAGVYLLLVTFEVPLLLKSGFRLIAEDNTSSRDGLFRDNSIESGGLGDQGKPFLHSHLEDVLRQSEDDSQRKNAPLRPQRDSIRALQPSFHNEEMLPGDKVEYGRIISSILDQMNHTQGLSEIQRTAKEAWVTGSKAWEEVKGFAEQGNQIVEHRKVEGKIESCPHSISLTGKQMAKSGGIMLLPCGLTLGSSITLVGKPRHGHYEYNPKISNLKGGQSSTLVSQFIVELQGLKSVDGEDPPRILHFNPRLKGDWSGRPVIEQNTCYRMQWASAQRCEGWRSRAEEETVDGLVKCEKWIRDDEEGPKEIKTTWWLNRLIGHAKRSAVDWPYPFVEGQLFALTLSAGLEGYHANVDGRHVASFPYRTGFVLEDATGFSVNGDVDVHSVVATSLPVSNPSFSPQRLLDMSNKWKASPLPENPVDLFIGILSAGNHFAERMAVRKTWMQSELIRSSEVVARFFVGLSVRKEVNIQLKKEADFYGDIIIVPFIDSYELVVLKTVAICEYGVHKLSAKYIMKCDDDTFVRVDAVLKEVKRMSNEQGVYIGNLNYYHKPLRMGKWAVTYEEWPEEDYPPYANGPGYVISNDIADFVVSQHKNHTLRLFKMEDVSMGMWVERFNASTPVQYSHNWKFCQFGCIEDYYTAHYQSPRQMVCMWDKLSNGKAQCCNMRRR